MALASCPSLQGPHGEALAALKKACHNLFVPDLGGSYEVWKQRPLPAAILEYAAADVAHLHTMREAWGSAVSAEEMRAITTRRIEAAISGEQAPKGPHMAVRDF
jgi:ribonuclease D